MSVISGMALPVIVIVPMEHLHAKICPVCRNSNLLMMLVLIFVTIQGVIVDLLLATHVLRAQVLAPLAPLHPLV